MDTCLYFLYATLYTVLLIWGLYGIRKHDLAKWTSVIYVVILPLIYDNLILATGKWDGMGKEKLVSYFRHHLYDRFNSIRIFFRGCSIGN